MHILYVIDAVKGAPIVHAYGSCKHLAKMGHRIDLITNAPPEQFRDIGVNVHSVPNIKCGYPAVRIIFNDTMLFFKSLFKKCDVIYTRNALLAALFKIVRYNTPVVWEVNGLSSVELPLLGYSSPLKIRFAKFLEEKLLPCLIDGLVVVTRGVEEVLLKSGAPKEKIHLVRNGVNHQEFDPMKKRKNIRALYNIPDSDIVIVFVGKIYAWHGIEHLFKILGRILREKKNVKLLFVGDRREELNIKLQRLVTELSLSTNIIFTGWIDNNDIPDYIASADAGIHTGMHGYELNPIKVLEYMAASKPVIGTAFGLNELITESNGGIVIDPLDYEDSTKRILSLINNLDAMKKLGRNAREYVIRNHDWEKVTANLEDALKSIVDVGKT
jgi:glycosyltransferase involved in cell wall biosynthesis